MSSKILQTEAKSLRQASISIDPSEIRSRKVITLINRMKKVLDACPEGVALAAPQIGVNLRVFVVSPKIDVKPVYINPVIKKYSAKKVLLHEGCLSVANMYGMIKRSEKVTVEALDEHGRKFTRGASGLLAEIIQHEADHLDGRLFIDKATDLQEIKKDEKNI